MLSIIIVNYNVKYFLAQCLYSVQKAIEELDAEVIVIDNNSTDESVAWLQPKFPWVIFVANQQNTGYAKANNQGWRLAKGEYVLFLNPDTILSEDTFSKSLQVLKEQPRTGAVGVRMIDGRGRFLPESKRGFPTAAASFYKLSGLIRLFPHSKTIAQYYLGHLPEKENNEIDVLSGAYMMVRKKILERTNGFDETFFMYGEDVDLSYRIQQEGYTNYYLANCTIIHFKGESTRKDIKYVRLFYNAMNIFVKKHYGQSLWFVILLQVAIGFRGVLSSIAKLFSSGKQPATSNKTVHTLICGTAAEIKQAEDILLQDRRVKRNIQHAERMSEIPSLISAYRISEIVFCAGAITYHAIINAVQQLPQHITFKFFAVRGESIVGSGSASNNGKAVAV